MNFQVGDISRIPYIEPCERDSAHIKKVVNELIGLAESDWDSQETSWDFKRNPLV